MTRQNVTAAYPSASPLSAVPRPASFSAHWVYAFIVFELACQFALIIPGIDAIRSALRVAVFGGSLILMVLLPRGRFPHPALKAAIWAVLIVGLGIFHPETSSPVAGVAAIAMYVAILSPLLWVSGLSVDVNLLRRAAMVLWVYHTLSAGVGVLQMYYPGQFQPEPSAVFLSRGDALVEGGKITLASGQQVFRPMGLTDQPGGAASAGLSCIVFALGIWTVDRRVWISIACFLSMMCGFFCIYLSQVRSILVMAGVCLVVFGLIMLARRDYRRLMRFVVLIGLVITASTAWAFWVGGETTINRLMTLIEEDPTTVYYYGRGYHLQYTLEILLPQYPLGAGLGRWGMVNYYFARKAAFEEPLWAEIQWTAWLFDGGVPLMLAYSVAMLLAIWVTWRIAITPSAGDLSLWAAVFCASNVAALAVTFNYPIFMSQGGMEFWLLNACLWAAWKQRPVYTAPVLGGWGSGA